MTIICGGNRQEILEDDERTNHFATAETDTGQTVVKITSWSAVLGKGEEQRGGEYAIVPLTKKRKKRAQDGWSAIRDFPSLPLNRQKKKKMAISVTRSHVRSSYDFFFILNRAPFRIELYHERRDFVPGERENFC